MRRTFRTMLLGAAAMVGCGSDDPPPSCQKAMSHFYAAGCYYKDTNTTLTITLNDMITRCEASDASARTERCNDRFDDWLRCNNEVPATATTIADCDCSQEQSAFNSCL